MRIFLAGASGVIGVRLVRILREAGHEVAGMTRTPGKAESLGDLGVEPVVCDVFDLDMLRTVVSGFRPELVMHQLTDLPDDPVRLPEFIAANNRIRREGTNNLLAAADDVGARVLAQSIAWKLPGAAGEATLYLEQAVLGAEGTVVRYGRFYGPGTYCEQEPPSDPRIHVDAAAERTVEVLDFGPGVIEIIES